MTDQPTAVRDQCARARQASFELARASGARKNDALLAMAAALREPASVEGILAANAADVEAARAARMGESDTDRLALTEQRVADMADGVAALAALVDPVGETVRGYTLPNGLQLRQVRVPLGVVGIIYEGRPNVTSDAAAICLKSGNTALLRGSSSAAHSNTAITEVLRDAIEKAGLPADCVQLVGGDRSGVTELMNARGLVDVLIPRGGAGLIQNVVQNSSVPVIETGAGTCFLYAHADVDIDQAVPIVMNAKVQRPSVCNSLESLLVHTDAADDFLAAVLPALTAEGVRLHCDDRATKLASAAGVDPSLIDNVTEELWAEEHHGLELSVGVVDSLDEAVAMIRRFGTAHTDAILTRSTSAAGSFVAAVDSACVVVNASTRFTDGGEFGFGAEIGISTQKLHARGPMGLPELTSTKYVLVGDGHVRD